MQSDMSRAAAEVGKSIGVAAVFTLAAVLIFALLIKIFSIGSSIIVPVNQVIKMLAVFLGCFVCLRPTRAVLKGAVSGIGVILLTYFLFAVIGGAISFGWGNILDIVFGAIVGAISGIVCTLVKGKS